MRKKTYEDHYRDGEVAINIAAQALSKQAIKEEIKARGERLALVKPAEINAKAKVYLETHPGLWRLAWERALPAARTETLLTPEEVKQSTDNFDRDRLAAMASGVDRKKAL